MDLRSLIGVPQCADCLDLMRRLPAGVVDLAILDPPFNLGIDYGKDTDDNRPMDEYRQWLKVRVTEVERVLKPGRLIFMWQAMRHCLEVWQDYPQARLFAACKNFVQIRKIDVQWAFDPVLFWHKDSTQYIYTERRNEDIPRDWHIGNTARWIRDKVAQPGWHPCPRPPDTVEYIVKHWSKPGDLVLDPFLGSGTTMRVAQRLNRRCISGDICAEYVDKATVDLAQPQQLPMEVTA